MFVPLASCTNGNTYGPGHTNACVEIDVDINGATNGPNMIGMDYFGFWVVLTEWPYYIIPLGNGNGADGTWCLANGGWFHSSMGCTYNRMYTPGAMP